MNQITVKVELCEADRKRLDDILAALQAAGTPFAAAQAPAAEEPKSEPAQAPEVETQAEPEAPAAPAPQTKAAPEVNVSAEDIRQVLLVLNGAGKGAEAKAIIKEYAEKLSDIPSDKRLECLERLNKLGG